MTSALRKVSLLLVAAFLIFYLMTDPHGLADAAKAAANGAGHAIHALFGALISFFDSFKK
jgi:hypothetical protein